MIVDCHVHILNATVAHLDTLLRHANQAGVDRLCISSLSRTWTEFPSAAQIVEAADDVLDACAAHPDRFIGGVYASADHIETSLAMIERCVAKGPCRFLKLWISQYADDPRLDPIVERCIALDAPICAHTWVKATGNMTRESTYYHAVALARRHPQLKLWIAHASGRWEETARVIADAPNICVDISGGEPEDGIVDCLLKHLSPQRVFFGSDAPGRSFAVQMTKVLSSRVDDATKRFILGENFLRWLHV